MLAHDRRRILHIDVTDHPTAAWTAQQLREAFPWEAGPRYLLRDRDTIFGRDFAEQVAALGMSEVFSTRGGAPWQRAYIERVIGTIRRECLDHVIVVGERTLRRQLNSFVAYYHRSRTHLGATEGCARAEASAGTRKWPDRRVSGGGRSAPSIRAPSSLKKSRSPIRGMAGRFRRPLLH